MIVRRGDLDVLFFSYHNGDRLEERVQISFGSGYAETWLTLQEFCELMGECRKEIVLRHWQPRADPAQMEEVRA